jgi:rhamnosyl/mannosyltransferase
LRILHVYKDYPPVLGGIELHVRDLTEALARRGHDVTVLVTGPGRHTLTSIEGGVEVVRCPRIFTTASTPVSPALAVELRGRRADVTHLHIPYPVGEAAWLAVGRRPMVATYHSDIVRQRVLGRLWAPVLARTLDRCDRILATSPVYARTSAFLSGRPNVAVVPLGIDPAPFLEADGEASRVRYGPGPTVLFVGRLRYYKGVDVLLDALAGLPGVTLLVVGTGPQAPELERAAHALGINDRVKWLGDVASSDLPGVFAASDLFVLPAVARSEAFGVVQLEAMAAGLPVITTELGTGTSWVTQHGETGLVVRPRDADALRGAIQELLVDPVRGREMGIAGRIRMLNLFTRDHMVEAVVHVYESAVGQAA